MTVLKPSNRTPAEEKEIRRRLEEIGRQVRLSSTSQILQIADGKKPLNDTSIKKKWSHLFKNLKAIAKIAGEDSCMDIIYSDVQGDICLYVLENREKVNLIPAKKFPSFVFWKMVKNSDKKVRKANADRMSLSLNEEWATISSSTDDLRLTHPHCMEYRGMYYILIDGIAEEVGCSSETLRRWERQGKIKFTHIPYKSRVKNTDFYRGVPYEEFSDFVSKAIGIKEEKPPTGYFSTKEALRKLGVHHTTLARWRDAGKIPFRKIRGQYFYKV